MFQNTSNDDLFSMISIYNLLFASGMVDDCIHLFLGGALFVLYQIFVTSSDTPVVWFGHTTTEWPTT